MIIGIFLFTSLFAAQPVAQDDESSKLFAGLRVGDRIEVSLKNEGRFKGIVKRLTPSEVGIDISLEYVRMNGVLTLSTAEILAVKKLAEMSREEKERITAEKAGYIERAEAEHKKREEEKKKMDDDDFERAAKLLEGEETPKKDDKVSQAVEKAKRYAQGLELLQKFPPKDGWGQEKLDDLKARFVRIKVPLTESEREFVNNYDLWKESKESLEKEVKESLTPKKTESEKESPEEKKAPAEKEESPAVPPTPEENKP